MHGTVILLPCVNMSGFVQETDAYIPEDHGNLNQDYPGEGNGTTAYFTKACYPESEEEGLWYPSIRENTRIRKGDILGHTEDMDGNILHSYTAECDGIVLYYRTFLHVSKGTPLAAYACTS